MDLGKLAADVTAVLAPLLPYLQRAGGRVADDVGKKMGEGLWEAARTMWGLIAPQVEAKESASEAVKELMRSPDDRGARGAVELQLKQILATDERLAREAARLVKEASNQAYSARLEGGGAIAQGSGAVAAGRRGVAAGRDVKGFAQPYGEDGPDDNDGG